MNRIAIRPEGRFSSGGENFVVGGHVPPKDQRPSTSEAFTIAKNEPYLRVYEDLASAFSLRSILELGIFQGGSYVLLYNFLNPGECRLWTLVETLWKRYVTRLPIRRTGLCTFPPRSPMAKFGVYCSEWTCERARSGG